VNLHEPRAFVGIRGDDLPVDLRHLLT
jgi:hypothetical protein